MNICFYAPFKPLGHPNPSGDLIIATGLYGYFRNRGHKVRPVSDLRARWIYWKPWQWPKILKELWRIMRGAGRDQPDLWLTYHTYYKAPDLLGPFGARQRRGHARLGQVPVDSQLGQRFAIFFCDGP